MLIKAHGILLGTAGLALIVAGCSGGGTSSQDVADFKKACDKEMTVPAGFCDCIADTANEQLSDKQFEFLLAAIEQDEAETALLRSQMNFTELTEASMFMLNGTQDCAAKYDVDMDE